LDYAGGHRYFAVMAGTGPDGALAYDVLGAHKSRLGRVAYYAHAARLFATHHFRPFSIRYREALSGTIQSGSAVSVMGVRVNDLGGLFRGLTSRNASLQDPHLRVQFLAPPATISLPLWFLSGWLDLHRLNPFLKYVDVSEISSCGDSNMRNHIQVDGEWLGRGAMSLSLIPSALRIRVPLNAVTSVQPALGLAPNRAAL
jgi:diacylglycerol kinase family enzyme